MKTSSAVAACTMLSAATVHAQGDQQRPDLAPPPADVRPATAAATVTAPPRAAVCAAPLLTAMVTDDPYNTAADVAEQWRALRIPAWHATAKTLALQSRCYTLIDADPLLLALPGAVMPDMILRVRAVKATLYEKTVGDKIDEGVRSYIESYTTWLGAKSTTDGPPLLSEIGINVSVLCPLLRRVERDIAATDDAPVQALLNQNREYTGPQQNAERAERAIAKALDQISAPLARGERPCASPKAAALPATPPQTPGQSGAPQPSFNPALALTPALGPISGGAFVSPRELPK